MEQAELTAPQPTPAPKPQQSVAVPKATDDIPDDTHCPECGIELTEGVDRSKHAVLHYGDAPLPNIPQTRIARQRRAFLLGDEIPRV